MYLLYASQHSTIHDHNFQIFYTHLYGTLLAVNLTENDMTSLTADAFRHIICNCILILTTLKMAT